MSEQLSESRRARLDVAVDSLLASEQQRARRLLDEHRALHGALVALLLEKKVLDATALSALPGVPVLPVLPGDHLEVKHG